jgi:uncharacterized protein (DUF3820 family)
MMRRKAYNNKTNRYIGQSSYSGHINATGDSYIKGIKLDSELKFGKYKGKVASSILDIHPGYFLWLKRNTPTLIHPELIAADIKAIQHLKTSSKEEHL